MNLEDNEGNIWGLGFTNPMVVPVYEAVSVGECILRACKVRGSPSAELEGIRKATLLSGAFRGAADIARSVKMLTATSSLGAKLISKLILLVYPRNGPARDPRRGQRAGIYPCDTGMRIETQQPPRGMVCTTSSDGYLMPWSIRQ